MKTRFYAFAALLACMPIIGGCYFIVSKTLGGDFTLPPDTLNKICLDNNKSEKEELACALIIAAFDGIKEGYVDHHVHSIGFYSGGGDRTQKNKPPAHDSKTPYINPRRLDWLYTDGPDEPYGLFQRLFLYLKTIGLRTAFVIPDVGKTNEQFIDRIEALAKAIENLDGSPSVSIKLLAFDAYYKKKNGKPNKTFTDIYVPNDYVIDMVNHLNGNKFDGRKVFEAVGSVHPFRSDWKKELRRLAAAGVTSIKWLPNTMGIDPSNDGLDEFYEEMASLDMALITHTGYEEATEARHVNQRFGNPLLWEKALKKGVRVVMAHSGYKGASCEPEAGRGAEWNVDLFREMVAKEEYKGLLFGDISSLIFIEEENFFNVHLDEKDKWKAKECRKNLRGKQWEAQIGILKEIMEKNSGFQGRLINGSDYPLPGIKYINPTGFLQNRGFLTKKEKGALDLIYRYNPFLFDFALKRTISHPDDIENKISGKGRVRRLPKEIFGKLENLPGF